MNETKARDSLRQLRRLVCGAAMFAGVLWAMPAARAELQIEVTSGVRDPA